MIWKGMTVFLAPLAAEFCTTITLRGCCRRIPFNRQPLWSSAAVSSHQDVLEASHCASLTANLRQLADVVQHASQMFDRLNGQVKNIQAEHNGFVSFHALPAMLLCCRVSTLQIAVNEQS